MLTTRNLKVAIFAPTAGQPIEGATVTAILDRGEVDNGYIVQRRVTAVTDENGEATLSLWPNSRGSGESRYVVFAVDSDRRGLFEVALDMPDADCNLSDVAGAPLGDIDTTPSTLAQIQRFRDEANAAAQKAVRVADDIESPAGAVEAARDSADAAASSADRAAQSANGIDQSAVAASNSASDAANAAGAASAAAAAASSSASASDTAAAAATAAQAAAESLRSEMQSLADQINAGAFMPRPPTTGGPYVATADGEWVEVETAPDTPLSVTAGDVTTADTTPQLTGTVSDPGAVISIELVARDALSVTADNLNTPDTTPEITGTVSDPDATVSIEVIAA